MATKLKACTTGYIITIIRGISLSLPFTYKAPDGTPIDLTGKEVVFKLKLDGVIHTYTSTPNTYGSVVTITDAVNGEFLVLVTDEETTTFDLITGRWWLELHESGNITLLFRDDVIIEDV
jgi:hypothetical protein